ncbi:MAG: hypothetical protein ACHREM_05060 [Polyangiales bacterium]
MAAEEHLRLQVQLNTLMRQVGALLPAQHAGFTRQLDLRPPPLVDAAIARDTTVARLLAAVGARPWLALFGDIGVGKTHIAGLLARSRGESIWIRTRGVGAVEAAARVEQAIDSWSTAFPATVVVDDLPLIRDELHGALSRLRREIGSNTLVVSTSNHRLGPRALAYLSTDDVLEEPCPLLSDDEAGALLRAHGADTLPVKVVSYLNALARRHPTLLTAIGRYLRTRAWVCDEAALGALFAQEHLSEVNDDTIRMIRESVASDDSRMLLYRLKLVHGTFDIGLAGRLGAVPPAVGMIHERLVELDGLWVQRQNDDRYATSPLVNALPRSVVEDSTRIACSKILGAHTMSGTVTPKHLVDATAYYADAREFDLAAQALSFGLVHFALEERPVSPGDMLLLWWDSPLPAEMSSDAAFSLRCAQIAAGVRAKKDIDALVDDVESRISDRTLCWGHVLGATVAFQPLLRTHTRTAFSLLRSALRDFDRAQFPNGERLSVNMPVRPELLAWLVAADISTPLQVSEWTTFVADLTPSSRDVSHELLSFRQASIIVLDSIWKREIEKPEADRRWSVVEATLTSIRSVALTKGNLYLAAVATRALMVVVAEYVDRSADAIALAHETLALANDDLAASYLIQECLGRQALYRGDFQGAREGIDAALALLPNDEAGGIDVLQTLNAAARAVWRTTPKDAVAYARRAMSVAQGLGTAGRLELARVCGELAVACEHAGNRDDAYAALSAGTEALLAHSRTSDSWKRTAAILAHATGYITRAMTSGGPPAVAAGAEPYARPEQGVFYFASEDASRVLQPQALSAVCVMLAEFGSTIGADDSALLWGRRTLEEADADPTGEAPKFVSMALPHMVRGALADVSSLSDAIVASVVATRPHSAQPDTFVLALSIMPLASEILRLSAVDESAAIAVCREAERLCEGVAERLQGSPLWHRAATVFNTAASESVDINELVRLANDLGRSGAHVIQVIAVLLASVDTRRTLRGVAQAHVAVLAALESTEFRHFRERVLGDLERYWRSTLVAAPFRFSHPRALKEHIATLSELAVAERASAVVRAVADDLHVRR